MEIFPGLQGIVLTESRLSRVEGEAGELTIAGFPLQELALNAVFEEALYLLWHDRLPAAAELEALRVDMAAQRVILDETLGLLEAAAERRLPAMDALRMGVDTFSLADTDPDDLSREANLRRALALTARMPTVVAAYWRLRNGLEPVEPDSDLSHAANYLAMLTGQQPHESAVRALDTYLNTVIDHGMNASTFAGRVIISTRSDMISAIVGAIGALKGLIHGGAPGPALDMVFEIRELSQASGRPLAEEAEDWVRAQVEAGERIMGFGHRVYRVRDPRADVLGAAAAQLFERTGDAGLYEDAQTVERVVLRLLEELKPGRRLQTNVEFYTALVLHGVGLEPELFTPTFAIARVGGWSAHVLEQIDEDRLIRPRASYKGEVDRRWIALEDRK